jgi:hypothetical protein
VSKRLLVVAASGVPAFPPTKIVVLTFPEEQASSLESGAAKAADERFDLPVTHLVVD